MSAFPGDMSLLTNGLYDLGIQVTCHGETFVSDIVKGSIDRHLPEVQTTFPLDGGSLDSFDDIHVIFNEPINCYQTIVIMTLGNQTAIEVPFNCKDELVRVNLQAHVRCFAALLCVILKCLFHNFIAV